MLFAVIMDFDQIRAGAILWKRFFQRLIPVATFDTFLVRVYK